MLRDRYSQRVRLHKGIGVSFRLGGKFRVEFIVEKNFNNRLRVSTLVNQESDVRGLEKT